MPETDLDEMLAYNAFITVIDNIKEAPDFPTKDKTLVLLTTLAAREYAIAKERKNKYVDDQNKT
jgi:hypothetical protein